MTASPGDFKDSFTLKRLRFQELRELPDAQGARAGQDRVGAGLLSTSHLCYDWTEGAMAGTDDPFGFFWKEGREHFEDSSAACQSCLGDWQHYKHASCGEPRGWAWQDLLKYCDELLFLLHGKRKKASKRFDF